jgi:hypothetical protein
MSERSDFELSFDGVQVSPSPYGQNVRGSRSIRKALLAGDSTDQIRNIFAREAVLAASGTFSLDLRTDTDRFGNALAADDLCMLYVENVDDVTGGGALEIRPNGVNGFTNLLGAASALKLPVGAFVCVACFTADKYDVNNANKVLDFVETGGALGVLLRIHVWVRE